MLRSIALYPRFVAGDAIARVRSRFDPLATKVPPHVTLVFPFSSELSRDALVAHMSTAIAGVGLFPVSLGDPVAIDGIVQLPVLAGEETIRLLHRRLYSGLLERFLRSDHACSPHLTVGRCPVSEERWECLQEAASIAGTTGVADAVSCEIIERDESSTREIDILLT